MICTSNLEVSIDCEQTINVCPKFIAFKGSASGKPQTPNFKLETPSPKPSTPYPKFQIPHHTL
jgi:hypothetical protein